MAKSISSEITSNNCFVIMPISDPEGYEKGHFKKVHEDIFKIAIEKAGFVPIRADEVLPTNFIHLDILQKLIESPMAICDLSSRNPNVLFELGLRQAFDKPTVLVQEVGTPKIFDIVPLRMTDYRKELLYREVLEDQNSIAEVIKATKIATDNGEGINSLINLLSLSSPASLKDITDKDSTKMFQIVMAEINELRADFRNSIKRFDEKSYIQHKTDLVEFEKISREFQDLLSVNEKGAPRELIQDIAKNLQYRIMKMMDLTTSMKLKSICRDYIMQLEDLQLKCRHDIDNK